MKTILQVLIALSLAFFLTAIPLIYVWTISNQEQHYARLLK
jgi:hypothetical protein